MHKLVSIRLALMASDEEAESIAVQEAPRHIGSEVRPPAPEAVRPTTQVGLGVRPEQVQHLWGMVGGSLEVLYSSIRLFVTEVNIYEKICKVCVSYIKA